MRILDETSSMSITRVTLYLTQSEASELRDSLNDILEKPFDNHSHVSDEDYQKEITVCIYDKKDLKGFDKRSIDLINDDK